MLVEIQPDTIAQYRILEPLGRGGMGVVYLAEPSPGAERVALKTVLAPAAALLRSLRREVQALSRLRHPGIVRILDEGVHEGLPWYAMELVPGMPLHRYCAQFENRDQAPADRTGVEPAEALAWWTHSLARASTRDPPAGQAAQSSSRRAPPPRPPPEARHPVAREALGPVLRVLHRLCAPLAFLHGEGFVHRDLKPDNVLVRADGTPVLMDFGLASSFTGPLARESLDHWGAAGTVAYMAPEQGRGDLLDARADLYSLGCILYELLTGRQPFLAASPLKVLDQHFTARPLPPSQFADGLPEGLDDLVLCLLAKEPWQRFGYAGDVAEALERLGVEPGPQVPAPLPRPYLYRPRFGGREAELRQLLGRLDGPGSAPADETGVRAKAAKRRDVRGAPGGILLIGGESGIGKTRLALEVANTAVGRGLQVFIGECLPSGQEGSAGALQPLRRTLLELADQCRAQEPQATQRLLGPHARLLGLYEPALAELPGLEEAPELAPLPPREARHRLFHSLRAALAALAGKAPVLLLIDDLQWADELTLGFLESLAGAPWPASLPLFVLGTYRSEEVDPRGRPALAELLQQELVVQVRLGRLDEEAVASMVGDMLAVRPPPKLFSRYLARQSEGNPFFVAEYLRASIEEGLLLRDGMGRWQVGRADGRAATEQDYEALSLPSSVRELVARRLALLSPEALELAEVAATVGREAALSVLEAMVSGPSAPGPLPLVELMRRGVLEEAGPESVRFVHDKLREGAYAGISAGRLPALHRAAAEALSTSLEGAAAHKRDLHLGGLGRHWELAGEKARACHAYSAAARLALSRYAHAEADRLFRAYLRLVESPTVQSIEARLQLAHEVLHRHGHRREALSEHEQAAAEARSIGDLALELRAWLGIGNAQRSLGAIDQACTAFEQAQELAQQAGNLVASSRAVMHLANLASNAGRWDASRALYERAVALQRASGDRKEEAFALGNLGALEHNLGRLEQAEALYQRTLLLHRESGYRRGEGLVLHNLGVLRVLQGRMLEAQVFLEQALDVQRRIQDRTGEAVTLSNLADCVLAAGDRQEARRLIEAAIDLHREVGNLPYLGENLRGLASWERRCTPAPLAELEALESDVLLAEAEEIFRRIGNEPQQLLTLCERGFQALAHGRPAEIFLAEAREIAERLQMPPASRFRGELERLERAVERQAAGGAGLYRGEPLEDVPAALARPQV